MRKLLSYFTIVFLSIFSITLLANEHEEANGQRHEKRFEHMAKKLDLSEEQIDHVKIIMESQKEHREALYKEQKATRVKMKALQNNFRQQLDGVLTEEQLEKFDKMHERRNMMMKRGKGNREHNMRRHMQKSHDQDSSK